MGPYSRYQSAEERRRDAAKGTPEECLLARMLDITEEALRRGRLEGAQWMRDHVERAADCVEPVLDAETVVLRHTAVRSR